MCNIYNNNLDQCYKVQGQLNVKGRIKSFRKKLIVLVPESKL